MKQIEFSEYKDYCNDAVEVIRVIRQNKQGLRCYFNSTITKHLNLTIEDKTIFALLQADGSVLLFRNSKVADAIRGMK